MNVLKATQVYPGHIGIQMFGSDTPKPHKAEGWYFCQNGYASPVPFSREYKDQAAAELAALEWEGRFDLRKLEKMGVQVKGE